MYLVQTTIPYASGLPRDVITNTTHWDIVGGFAPAMGDEIRDRMQAYYEDVYAPLGGTRTWASYIQHKMIIKIYLANPPVSPAPPVYVDEVSLTFTGSATGNLPAEVAVVTSQYSAQQAGLPLGRRFNRHYIGGLSGQVLDNLGVPLQPPFVTADFRAQLAGAASTLHGENTTILSWVLGYRSSGVWQFEPIVGGFVGDEPDTQRRRGIRQAVRTSWSA